MQVDITWTETEICKCEKEIQRDVQVQMKTDIYKQVGEKETEERVNHVT